MEDYLPLTYLRKKYKVSKGKLYKATMRNEFPFRRGGKKGSQIFCKTSEFLKWLIPVEVPAKNSK
jgi:hypothetical protein